MSKYRIKPTKQEEKEQAEKEKGLWYGLIFFIVLVILFAK